MEKMIRNPPMIEKRKTTSFRPMTQHAITKSVLLSTILTAIIIQSSSSFQIASKPPLEISLGRSNVHLQQQNLFPQNHQQSIHSSSVLFSSPKRNSSNKTLNTNNKKKNSNNNRNNGKKRKRKPQSNSVAIRWVVESIEKILMNEQKAKFLNNKNNNSKQSAEMITFDSGCNTMDDDEILLDALCQMYQGKSKQEIIQAGKVIQSIDINKKFSFSIQERVMKVTAMAGLIQLSCEILNSMTKENNYFPSSMGYVSVFNGLRRVQKLEILHETLCTLSDVCRKTNQNVQTVALNSYLGAICDVAISSRNNDTCNKMLRDAIGLLQPNIARERYMISDGPDIISYNTVLNAALSIKNQNMTLVQEIIDLIHANDDIIEDMYTYNLKLKAFGNGVANTADKIAIIDEILAHPILTPDKFTIEQALLPLAREGRIGDILEILWNFNNSQKESPVSVSNAYSTFFIALVKGGEVDIARSIFDTYILPIRTSKQQEQRGNKYTIFEAQVSPITRHFNVLIDGYSSLNEREARNSTDNGKHVTPLEHCNALYETMIASNIKPDVYTISSLMGLQEKSSSVTTLWQKAMELDIPLTPPVYHSLIMAYGRANDPSSACYIFDRMLNTHSLSNTLNSWNVLLSALSQVSRKEGRVPLACLESSAYNADESLNTKQLNERLLPGGNSFLSMVNGKDVTHASFEILQTMKDATNNEDYESWILRPNSQTYCLVASIISRRGQKDGDKAMELYHDAMQWNIPPDGRFINAVIRSFGNDIDGAIQRWKTDLRSAVASYENRERPEYSKHKRGKNLIAAYHGLINVAGKAGRPDIALRITYAMKKEGFEPTESTLNSYKTGARENKKEKSIRLNKQYENLLVVECTKYSQLDKRRSSEKRVRIII